MNHLNVLSSLAIALTLGGCLRHDVETGTPECIIDKIREFKKAGCEDRKVSKYKFQGAEVIVFEPGTCGADMTADVYDMNCKLLGTLGGIGGSTTINGANFSQAERLSTVWEQ